MAGGEGYEQSQPIEIEGELEWEVDTILRHRKKRNSTTLQYLDKYVGYDASDSVWLDESDLVHASDVLSAYKTSHGL